MRLGYVVPGGVDRSGRERVIPHLVERLGWLAAHHDVRVVALRQEGTPGRWELGGVEVHNVGLRPRRLRALRLLGRLHRERPFDLLHGFALVPQGVVAVAAGRILGIPVVVEAPGGEFAGLPEADFGGWRRLPGRLWIRLSAAAAGSVVVPSGASRALAERRGIAARHLPLGIDAAAWPDRDPRPRTGEEPLRLLWVGTLNRVKDPWAALEVVARLREEGVPVELTMVGQDLLDGAVVRAAREQGLQGVVRRTGWIPQPDLVREVDRTALLLVTSAFEGAGRVVLEAAARGVPTVGYPVGLVADWAPEAARAVSHDLGPGGLARAVASLAADEVERLRLARAAGARVVRHRFHRVGTAWEELYGSMTGVRAVHGAGRG